jgi:predicted transcriptional regulator
MSSSDDNNHDKTWRFLSNHTQVLLCLHRDPDARFRDIAQSVGITERAAQRIVADLVESGYVESERSGRRNHYTIRTKIAMRHPAQHGHEIGELLQLLQLKDD